MHPKHVAVLVIKSRETTSFVELVGTDWRSLCMQTAGWETHRFYSVTHGTVCEADICTIVCVTVYALSIQRTTMNDKFRRL